MAVPPRQRRGRRTCQGTAVVVAVAELNGASRGMRIAGTVCMPAWAAAYDFNGVPEHHLRCLPDMWAPSPGHGANRFVTATPSAARLLAVFQPGHTYCGSRVHWVAPIRMGKLHISVHASIDMTCPGLEPGISGSGGRRLIHWANRPFAKFHVVGCMRTDRSLSQLITAPLA